MSTRSFFDPVADLLQHVVDLVGRRAHLDHRDRPARSAAPAARRPGRRARSRSRRRRRDEHRLAHLAFEFLELQRPVVERRRQAKAVVDQRGLARAVAVVHAAELADHDVALVEEHQRVLRQVVDQRRRRLAGAGRPTGAGCSSRCPCSGRSPAASRDRSGCAARAAAPRPACPALTSSSSRSRSSS